MTEPLPSLAARLRQIGRACSDAADDLNDGAGANDQNEPPITLMPDDPRLATIAERFLKLRRERERLFGAALFADPAWDILLDLFVHQLRRRRISVSSLCIAAAVPATTALRYISLLESEGLVTSSRASDDLRKRYVELTPDACGKLRELLRKLETSGERP